jgi:hypothetical protein
MRFALNGFHGLAYSQTPFVADRVQQQQYHQWSAFEQFSNGALLTLLLRQL